MGFSISNYRGIKHIELPTPGYLNLVNGDNNAGKSSVLEAIYLYVNNFSASSIQRVLKYKKYSNNNNIARPLDSLFSGVSTLFQNQQSHIPIDIVINDLSKSFLEIAASSPQFDAAMGEMLIPSASYQVKIAGDSKVFNKSLYFRANELKSHDTANANFLTPYGFVEDSGKQLPDNGKSMLEDIQLTEDEKVFSSFVQLFDDSILHIRAIGSNVEYGSPDFIVKTTKFDRPVPITIFGDGMRKVLNIGLALATSRNKVVLIDEFENGLHYSVQEKLLPAMFAIAKQNNIKIFITTHSFDTITTFLRHWEEIQKQPSYIPGQMTGVKLERSKDGEIISVPINEEDLTYLINAKYDIR